MDALERAGRRRRRGCARIPAQRPERHHDRGRHGDGLSRRRDRDVGAQPVVADTAEPHQQHVEARSAWEGTITFYTTVTGAGAAAAALLTDEAIASPSVVDLGTVTGDAPAPLAIDVNAGWDTGANGMRDCVLALVETTTLANYLYQAEDAGGWTVVTDADAQPDAADDAARTNSATWDDLAFGPVTAGTWRVARAHREAGESGYIALSEDGATSYQRTRITSSNYRLYDLGEFVWDGVIDLHLLGMGTDYVTLDYVLLVPSGRLRPLLLRRR